MTRTADRLKVRLIAQSNMLPYILDASVVLPLFRTWPGQPLSTWCRRRSVVDVAVSRSLPACHWPDDVTSPAKVSTGPAAVRVHVRRILILDSCPLPSLAFGHSSGNSCLTLIALPPPVHERHHRAAWDGTTSSSTIVILHTAPRGCEWRTATSAMCLLPPLLSM